MGLAPLLSTSPEGDIATAEERASGGAAIDEERSRRWAPLAAALWVAGFIVLWCAFYAFNRAVPYVANGSDIVKLTKKEYEAAGDAFPRGFTGTKLAVFGNSKVLSGFIPDQFDALAANDHVALYSFNSGLPAQSMFLHEFKSMVEDGPAPDVVLLTIPWQPAPSGNPIFTLPAGDNEIADTVFPFRLLARNLSRFVADSARFGGPANLYRREKAESERMLHARGYYFIRGQMSYGDSLPANYTLPTDDPSHVELRKADFHSPELKELNEIIQSRNIRCFYVPTHLRSTEAAPAPAVDAQFATELAQNSTCRAVGPDYITYSPTLYTDDEHLNEQGAKLYTKAIYDLISPYLREQPNALQ